MKSQEHIILWKIDFYLYWMGFLWCWINNDFSRDHASSADIQNTYVNIIQENILVRRLLLVSMKKFWVLLLFLSIKIFFHHWYYFHQKVTEKFDLSLDFWRDDTQHFQLTNYLMPYVLKTWKICQLCQLDHLPRQHLSLDLHIHFRFIHYRKTRIEFKNSNLIQQQTLSHFW